MRIRLKTLMAGPEGVSLPGSVIEVAPEEARVLISGRDKKDKLSGHWALPQAHLHACRSRRV